MAVNKVVFGGETVIDLTKDTVSPETLAEGVTAHDKSGKAIVGTMQAGGGDAGGGSDISAAIEYFVEYGVSGAYRNDTSVYVRPCAFAMCTEMTSADFAVLEGLEMDTFMSCGSLKTVILRSLQGVFCGGFGNLSDTPINYGSGIILVPQDLLDDYKSGMYGTEWEYYADQFRAIEDFTVDGTVTGEIDWEIVEEELSSLESNLYTVYIRYSEEEEWEEVTTINGEPGMSWYDWVYSDYNADGMFALSDDEMYVMCDGNFYVTYPDGTALTSDCPIDSCDGAVYLTDRDNVQGVE